MRGSKKERRPRRERERESQEETGKEKKGRKKVEEEPGCRREKLQKVGVFSYSGYSCLVPIQWLWVQPC